MTRSAPGHTIAGVRAPFLIFGATIIAVAACGARSQLYVEDFPPHEPEPGPDVEDAGPDVEDAPPDAPPDVVDAPPDAPPPSECDDAGITYIYLITEQNRLLHFYPPTGEIVTVGMIDCPSQSTPFSMAVDRKGTAYVLFQDGNLFAVSTADASCQATSYIPAQDGFVNFGMGYSADITDPGETLFVARDSGQAGVAGSLGSIDTTTFNLTDVGTFSEDIGEAELTGTGAGDLYGFGVELGTTPVVLHLAQINKPDATILQDNFITLESNPSSIDGWAFAYYGGDFYFFTATPTGVTGGARPPSPGTPPATEARSRRRSSRTTPTPSSGPGSPPARRWSRRERAQAAQRAPRGRGSRAPPPAQVLPHLPARGDGRSRRVHPDDRVGGRQPLALRRRRRAELRLGPRHPAREALPPAEPRGEGRGRPLRRERRGPRSRRPPPERQGADPLRPPGIAGAALGHGTSKLYVYRLDGVQLRTLSPKK